jgi:hypothetical protein
MAPSLSATLSADLHKIWELLVVDEANFEKALFVYPKEHLEMRQGARIILKSKES